MRVNVWESQSSGSTLFNFPFGEASPKFVHRPRCQQIEFFPRDRLGADRALDDTGVNFDPTIRQKTLQCFAPGESAADRCWGLELARDLAQLLFPKLKEAGDDGY